MNYNCLSAFNESAAASSVIYWLITAVVVVIVWLAICRIFRVRFAKGNFYLIEYTKVGGHWTCSHPYIYKSNKAQGVFPAQIIPFGCVKKNVGGITFRTVREKLYLNVIPTFMVSDNNTLIGHDTPCTKKIDPTQSMLKVAEAGDFVNYTESDLGGTPITKHTALTKNTVIFKKLSEESIIAVVFIPQK